MALIFAHEKLENSKNPKTEDQENEEEEEEEEEEEALSLCDLPINLLTGKSRNGEEEEEKVKPKGSETEEDQKDFDFRSWVGGSSVLTESEMCVADEVFFQGQILPLRLSVSSDIGLPRFKNDIRCNSRSESLDHRCCSSSGRGGGGYGYYSSRSSSCRSHLSSSSTNSTTTTATTNYKSRIRNQFHTHPSPKPQIRIPTIPGRNPAAGGGRSRKSSIWDIFKLGLVRKGKERKVCIIIEHLNG